MKQARRTDDPLQVAIFGATSAIAVAVARHYAEQGASLFLVGRRHAQLERLAADLGVRSGAQVAFAVADLADPANHGAIVAEARRTLPHPDVALVSWGTLTDQERAETDSVYAADELVNNFAAPASLLLHLAEWFRPQGQGVLAVITSVAGDRGRQSNFVYGAAKGGLQRFLEGLRHRLVDSGVTVLDIRPGFVATPMTEHLPQGGLLWETSESAAADIVAAIAARRHVVYTRWFWRWIMLIIANLPRPLFHRMKI